jgi:hypothetical protein
MSRVTISIALGAAALGVALSASRPAQATLALTPAGVSDGFVLTTFVSGYNFGGGVNLWPIGRGRSAEWQHRERQLR